MANFRSLIPGGAFSSTPLDKSKGPVTVRMNNPGAINGAAWERTYPGYVDEVMTTPGNKSTIFETPEFGVGAWWDLLRRYRADNATTVNGIITKYGGGQDYSAYLQFVLRQTGFSSDTVIDLNNDQQVLQFGRAMFRYEAGCPLPWSDAQLLCGIQGGRTYANTKQWPLSPDSQVVSTTTPAPATADGQMTDGDLLALLQKLIIPLAATPANPPASVTAGTVTTSASTRQPQNAPPILSAIDSLFGGQTMVGYKTILGVLGYALVTILKAAGVLGAATPAGQILSVLTLALTALGGLSKVDRMTQALSTVATNPK